ncbi:hypothetical protein [uncultured Brachyspira sp.]|uniref:hypothetical protein n=1 Tax=uncultured Brachyspira sp. TaxID=221953 RepID=UPI00262B1794|nr:hypothetical protein [uncultured Brachyspira sp.]
MINKKRILKFILLMGLLSLTSLFLTSCSSLFDSASKFRPYDLRGTWRNKDNYRQRFTISSYGILTFYNDDGSYSTHYIENWDNEKYNEKSYYDLVIPNLPILGNITFYFTSDRECEISYGSVSLA